MSSELNSIPIPADLMKKLNGKTQLIFFSRLCTICEEITLHVKKKHLNIGMYFESEQSKQRLLYKQFTLAKLNH